MREIFEAKVAMMTRPGAADHDLFQWSRLSLRSDGVKPSESALVESDSSSSTPASPNAAQLLHLGQLAVDRVLVELVIRRMNDRAKRGMDHNANGIRDAVANVEELDAETPRARSRCPA